MPLPDLVHVMAALRSITDKLEKFDARILAMERQLQDTYEAVMELTMDEGEEGETDEESGESGEESGEENEGYDSSFIDDDTSYDPNTSSESEMTSSDGTHTEEIEIVD